ncbi:chromobox protein homolog 1 isoform X2 [Monomorium pharaonis]|uniref:chromobox protein homolog 1 isoform X2 n=1 Tax=Monomorium pharaonis TaxID=307658 RepID=UPI00063EDCD3|nr:chromobox protein homolog 1 isoform X2 [Monomorium pharaonis]
MNRDKLFFRSQLLDYFNLKKTATETHRLLFKVYGNKAPSERTCRAWFERFRNGNFNVRDKQRPGQPKRFENVQLQELLDENSSRSLVKLSKVLNVTPMAVSRRLHAMGKIYKEGKWLPRQKNVKTEIDSCEDIETNEHLYADCADHLNEMNSRKQTIQADDRPLGFRRGLEADKILGSADDNGELMYLIQWKGTDAVDMVSAKEANAKCPQIVIQFYEDRITWSKAKIKV